MIDTSKIPAAFSALIIDHLGIAVKALDDASEVYALLGFQAIGDDELIESQGVKVRAFQAGESLLELLEPTREDSPIAKYIEKRGEGLHHVAFRVDNLEAEIERLEKQGATFISTEIRAGRAGTRIVFLHPKWTKGVLVELVEHSH